MNNPYIGITDFTNARQVRDMLSMFTHPNRRLHVGVMMSYKTLHGIPSENTGVFPENTTIRDIFFPHKQLMCTVHYAGKSNLVRYPLENAIGFGGPHINALQLDMTWPDPQAVADAIAASGKQIEVILQIGRPAFDAIEDDTASLLQKLFEYKGIITHVLLDKSMGEGLPLDYEFLIPYVRVIREVHPELGVVVAGGVGPDSTELVKPFLDEFPDISFDAQGKLRPSGNYRDPIDWNMAGTYLQKVQKLCP